MKKCLPIFPPPQMQQNLFDSKSSSSEEPHSIPLPYTLQPSPYASVLSPLESRHFANEILLK